MPTLLRVHGPQNLKMSSGDFPKSLQPQKSAPPQNPSWNRVPRFHVEFPLPSPPPKKRGKKKEQNNRNTTTTTRSQNLATHNQWQRRCPKFLRRERHEPPRTPRKRSVEDFEVFTGGRGAQSVPGPPAGASSDGLATPQKCSTSKTLWLRRDHRQHSFSSLQS